jgi:hypothetical protein
MVETLLTIFEAESSGWSWLEGACPLCGEATTLMPLRLIRERTRQTRIVEVVSRMVCTRHRLKPSKVALVRRGTSTATPCRLLRLQAHRRPK